MRKYLLVSVGVAVALAASSVLPRGSARGQETRPEIRAYFSPKGGVMKAVYDRIRSARKSVDAALYMLTAPKLSWALVSAHKRGVKVRVIMDSRMTSKWSEIKTLERNGVPVWRVFLRQEKDDPSPPQFHDKFAVVDGDTVLTGSYNWTVMADERNYENLVVIRDGAVAAKYSEEFEKALKIAEKSKEEGK